MKEKKIPGPSVNDKKNPGLKSFSRIIVFLICLTLLVGNLSCGSEAGTEIRSETNSPPVITSVKIFPEKPNQETELRLIIQSYDPDRNPIQYDYQWIKNEEEIIGENKNILEGGVFRKGDLIRVRVTPSNGKVKGEPFLSAPVKILNSPPRIQEVWIEPKVPYVSDSLKVHVKSINIDGDPVRYTYRWEKNGIVLNEETGEVLERGRFKKGDSIAVTVFPDDGEASGRPQKSEPVTVANSPPLITSSPPAKTEGNIYTYQVTTDNPDNDPVIFRLKTAPKGMGINKETGLIRWEIGEGDQGMHPIEIEVSDTEGAKSLQRYTLSVRFR